MSTRASYMLPLMSAASLLVHAAALTGIGYLALRSLERDTRAPAPTARTLDSAGGFELPVVTEGTLLEDREADRTGDPVVPAGGDITPRAETGGAGAGGDPTVSRPALNLAAQDDGLRLSPDALSRLDRDQLQRLRTARTQASWEDRRATTQPTELTFLATGQGSHPERREVATRQPSRGAKQSPAAEVRGGELGAPAQGEGIAERHRVGMLHAGSLSTSPGAGIADGRVGLDHRSSAAITWARPDLVRGPVSVPSTARGRPNDVVDSDQEVATTVRALVHASTLGGAAGSSGRGGAGGGGAPASGGIDGRGARARPMGGGPGDWLDFDTQDPRLFGYFRHLHGRINPLWQDAFPRDALAELKQGTVILEFTVQADGSAAVSWPPLRPSGFDEFDQRCADAIRRAAPFDPIPASIGERTLRIRAPFVMRNPLVR